MWETVELREVRVFLALAEELHFARTAARLHLTQSRVSQSLRGLEAKLGVELVYRTSRRVELTAEGARFRDELADAYGRLAAVLQAAERIGGRLEGAIRVGLPNAASGGARLLEIVETFESEHPDCSVELVALPFHDRHGPLRRGEVAAMVTRLPLEMHGVVIGPVLAREPRILAVAPTHPLAGRDRVTLEDVADYEVAGLPLEPRELVERYIPTTTPAGRPIRRSKAPVDSLGDLVMQVARGKIVHPTVASFMAAAPADRVVSVPLDGVEPSKIALAWRRRDPDPRLRAFIATTKAVLAAPRRG
jgi:DNA-binding transcriptional LysR family regulator